MNTKIFNGIQTGILLLGLCEKPASIAPLKSQSKKKDRSNWTGFVSIHKYTSDKNEYTVCH